MEIKQALLNMVGNGYRSSIAAQQLFGIMFSDYLKNQNRQCIWRDSDDKFLNPFDLYFPDGIDEYEGNTAVEIKITPSLSVIRRVTHKLSIYNKNRGLPFNQIIIISLAELTDKYKGTLILECNQCFEQKIIIWDVDDLVNYFSKNSELFFDTYNNLNKILLQETVDRGIKLKKVSREKKQRSQIEFLQNAYKNNDIVLFLGAGVSKTANIATWDELISKLFIGLLNKELEKRDYQLAKKQQTLIEKKMVKQYGSSPLILTRFLKQGLDTGFENAVREVLYKKATNESPLLTEIAQLCVPGRKQFGVEAIVNYNFDDLIERQLNNLSIKNHSIYTEGMSAEKDELGIYHVHGFLPEHAEEYDNLSDSLLVFSEEGYHQLMIEPYHWANMRQLNYMINNTCVFIGLSMTDPNMRRLLDIAAQQQSDKNETCRHYAFMHRLNLSEDDENQKAIKEFEGVNEALQEDVFKGLGVNVIWYDEYDDLPDLIKQIKEHP